MQRSIVLRSEGKKNDKCEVCCVYVDKLRVDWSSQSFRIGIKSLIVPHLRSLFLSSEYNDCISIGSQKYQLGTTRIPRTMDCTIRLLFKGSYNWSLGCWSLSPSGLLGWPGEGLWGGCVAEGRVCVMGMALGTIPSTEGGRPPEAKLTTPGGYL